MSPDTLIVVMTVFVIISAVALLIQMGMLIGIYRVARAMQQKVEGTLPKVHSIMDKADSTLAQSRQHVIDITARANGIMGAASDIVNSAKDQLGKIDELVTDASNRARTQMDRAEMVLDDTMGRVQESVATVHQGINRPLREISGVAAGLRAAIAHLAQGARPSVAQVTQDEEMFI
jgi:ABC-type transporter Mla subunit MlaD